MKKKKEWGGSLTTPAKRGDLYQRGGGQFTGGGGLTYILFYRDKSFYYIPNRNQAFSLVNSKVQYFLSYCTLRKLYQIAWKPACNKRNTTLRCRTKQCIALSLVKLVNSPFGFVHQVWQASCNTLLRSAPSCSIPFALNIPSIKRLVGKTILKHFTPHID